MTRYIANVHGSEGYWSAHRESLKAACDTLPTLTVMIYPSDDSHWFNLMRLRPRYLEGTGLVPFPIKNQWLIDNPHNVDWWFSRRYGHREGVFLGWGSSAHR